MWKCPRRTWCFLCRSGSSFRTVVRWENICRIGSLTPQGFVRCKYLLQNEGLPTKSKRVSCCSFWAVTALCMNFISQFYRPKGNSGQPICRYEPGILYLWRFWKNPERIGKNNPSKLNGQRQGIHTEFWQRNTRLEHPSMAIYTSALCISPLLRSIHWSFLPAKSIKSLSPGWCSKCIVAPRVLVHWRRAVPLFLNRIICFTLLMVIGLPAIYYSLWWKTVKQSHSRKVLARVVNIMITSGQLHNIGWSVWMRIRT